MLTLTALALAVTAVQGQDWSWSGPLAAGRTLTIRNIVGDVTVERASGGTVEIQARKRAGRRGDPADVTIHRIETSSGIEVCVIYPNMDQDDDDCDRRSSRRGRHDDRDQNDTRVYFTVRLPAGAHLDAGTVAGDVIARGLRGGEVELASVSGDIDASDVTAPVLEVKTVSGDITLLGIASGDVAGETVSGDVEYSGEVRSQGRYDFQSLSGDVILMVPEGLSARVNASTFSGDFFSDFAMSMSGSMSTSRKSRRRISGTIGEGSASLDLQSFSGDVEIRRRGN